MSSITIILSIIALVDSVLSFIVIRGEKTSINKVFALFVLSAALWTAAISGFLLTSNIQNALWFANSYYVFALLIPSFFVLFAHYFSHENRSGRNLAIYILTPVILLSLTFFLKHTLILSDLSLVGGEKIVTVNKSFYIIYAIWFILLVVIGYYKLFQSYFENVSELKRRQLGVILWGTIPPFLLGMLFNLILPWFGYYNYIWLGPIFTVVMVSAISYAIAKHHLFNLRVIATEIFIFGLWLFILIRVIIASTLNEQIIEGVLLAATVLVGILLIRSVIKEVKTRENMEALAKELAGANDRLTMLDRQKSEFLPIASHQLRSPLTAIKGYSSMMLEGSFGKIDEPRLREAVERVYLSSERLVIIIEDFLNVSRIEQGRMQYEFTSVKLDKLVEEVITDLKPNIDKANLKLTFSAKKPGDYYITADYGKIKQVVTNIIDNSVKYTPQGSITIEIDKDEDTRKILLSVSDTGIGIAPEVMPLLFQKFTRAKGAALTNIQGTGLGLYVVKELMRANKGNVWVDSPGEGKGSTFYLEFMAE